MKVSPSNLLLNVNDIVFTCLEIAKASIFKHITRYLDHVLFSIGAEFVHSVVRKKPQELQV